jgi:hypothetical protein
MMAEDPYQGDAQFTVAVDGKKVGGTFTTTAVQWQGQAQEFDLYGNFGAGTHRVDVTFTNDTGKQNSAGQTMDAFDRNLYVISATLNGGQPGTGAPYWIASNGTHSLTVTAGSGSPQPPPPVVGADTISLVLSEDAWQGDAQFTLKVDGMAIAGPTAVTSPHGAGGPGQTFDFHGTWGAGHHDLEIGFVNDAYAGVGQDRNLYIQQVSYNGAGLMPQEQPLYWNGSVHIPT